MTVFLALLVTGLSFLVIGLVIFLFHAFHVLFAHAFHVLFAHVLHASPSVTVFLALLVTGLSFLVIGPVIFLFHAFHVLFAHAFHLVVPVLRPCALRCIPHFIRGGPRLDATIGAGVTGNPGLGLGGKRLRHGVHVPSAPVTAVSTCPVGYFLLLEEPEGSPQGNQRKHRERQYQDQSGSRLHRGQARTAGLWS